MKSFIFGLVLTGLVPMAHAESRLHCAYQFYGSPMADVSLALREDGSPGDSAEVSMGGVGSRPQSLPVTIASLGAGEKMHAWLGKDDPNSDIEMIVYQQPQSQGDSKLVNSHIPLGKEIWGHCELK